MSHFSFRPTRQRSLLAVLLLLTLAVIAPTSARGDKNKKKSSTAAAAPAGPRKFAFDPKKLVWPSPPNIARVRWLDYFAGEKIDYTSAANSKPKATWMDRLAGGQSEAEKFNPKTYPFQMI